MTAVLTPETTLASTDRHRLLADGMRLSAHDVARCDILAHLTGGGFAPSEAEWSLSTIERQLTGKRDNFDRTRNRSLLFAAVQVIAGVFMIATGVMGGGWISLAAGIGLAALACHRFVTVLALSFGDFVLAGK